VSWREAIAGRLRGSALAERTEEVVEEAESDAGWRSVGMGGEREAPFAEHREALALSDDAYRHNPLAFRIVELGVDFVLGRGAALRCSDQAAEEWLREWWAHPLNNLPLRQFDLCRELSLAGELFVTLHTSPLDGLTYLRPVPARQIDRIETSPEDLEDEWRYHQSVGGADHGIDGRWWSRDEMRHYAVNRLVGTTRGQGDLATLLPWLRRYKDWLTDRVRLNKHRQAFLFDVTLEGADRRALVARQTELAVPPEPGSVLVHNEKETWRAVRPEVGADESAADGLALRLMIAAGSGFPLHFLGEAEEANLATAEAMGAPTLRRLERRQHYFGWLLVDLARECLRRSGRFGDVEGLEIRAEMPSLSAEDGERVARAAASAAGALRTAREMGWVDDAEARALFGRFVRT
jgi:hypothetical protein